MPIANYSTEVSAQKTVGEIQGMLVGHKAKTILIDYDADGQPEGISFLVPSKYGDIPFRLPANIKQVEKLLINYRQHSPGAAALQRIHEQAYRVGWRIIKDWVRAQMAIIDTEMVTLEQVFLPYMGSGDKSLYKIMQEKKFYLLPEGKVEE